MDNGKIIKKEKKFISLVVYLRDAAPYLKFFLDTVLPVCEANFEQFEIVCVDDGSRDGTTELLKEYEQKLYCGLSGEEYKEAVCAFAEYYKEKEYEYEQLLMYFLFTYVCGAVYDRDLFSKVRLAVVNTMLIRELGIAVWLSKGRQLSFEDQVEIAHRYAREVEHSQPNIEAMEYMTAEEELFTLEKLLNGILG